MAGSPTRLPALVLFGHGARDLEWRRPIDAVRFRLVKCHPEHRVEIAFHEFIGPTLAETVAALHADGYREIIVVPVFIAQGGHLRREVPLEIESLRGRYPDCKLTLEPALGESSAVQDAFAVHCASLLESARQKN